jgi:hypothetical protein
MKSTNKTHVVLPEFVFMQLVHQALDSFEIGFVGRDDYAQLYGLLWGAGPSESGDDTRTYTVSYAGVDGSARSRRVGPPSADKGLIEKLDLMKSTWPHYRFLGDFHTRAYYRGIEDACQKIEHDKLYRYSVRDDNDYIENHSEEWEREYRIKLVVTVAMAKGSTDVFDDEPSLIRFDSSGYRIWIKAYYAEREKEKLRLTDDILLHCPFFV